MSRLTLDRLLTVEDVRRRARRRLPRIVFDYLDGGAEDEITLTRNRQDFARLTLRPRVLVDVSRRSQETSVCGTRIEAPLVLAPTGLMRLAHNEGELAVNRAAERTGTAFVVSNASTFTLERIAEEATSPPWFQLYPWRDRTFMSEMIERARSAGYTSLCVTVDVPVAGGRERDLRNGFAVPLRPTLRTLLDLSMHPGWVARVLMRSPIVLANLTDAAETRRVQKLARYMERLRNPGHDWSDLEWLRSCWDGPFIVKGVLHPHDAQRARDVGVNGVVVSNHGGRQLDGAPSSVSALADVVDAVGPDVDVILDGGIRRGTDVVKALALGARACMIGRPYWYGLASGGEAGVVRVIDILRQEIDRTMAMLGCRDIRELNRRHVDLA